MPIRIEDRVWRRIKVSRAGRVLTLTLSNPGMRNAVDPAMHEELAEIFYEANRDADSDIVVLTGEGADFCAGGDITWFRRALAGEIAKPSALEGKKIIFSMLDLEKPLIAKVRGPAVGLGATIALFCDTIFASETAVFIDPHVKVGIVAGDGGAVIWPHLIGHARAKEFLMTGDPVPAAEAWPAIASPSAAAQIERSACFMLPLPWVLLDEAGKPPSSSRLPRHDPSDRNNCVQ